MRQSWYIVLEHSIWCIAWGVVAPLASDLALILDLGWVRVVCGVAAYPLKLQFNLAWAAGYLGPVFEPAVQFLKITHGDPARVWFYLLPPIPNLVFLAFPTILTAGVRFHPLPWIGDRVRFHRAVTPEASRLPFHPPSFWPVALFGAGLSSLPLLWMFWVTTLFIAMVSGLGNALSHPPMRGDTTVIELIVNTLVLYALFGVPVLLFPFSLMLLRRRLLRARYRFRGPGRPISY